MQAIERSLAFHFLWLRPVENESTRVERWPNLALPFRGALPLLWTFVWTRCQGRRDIRTGGGGKGSLTLPNIDSNIIHYYYFTTGFTTPHDAR